MTADDYEQTVEPLLAEELRQDRRLRLLLEIGPEFVGFTAGALWGKVETWRHSPTLLRRIDGYALVSDVRWIVRFLVSFPLRVDALGATADTWLATHDALPRRRAPRPHLPGVGEHRQPAAPRPLRARPPPQGAPRRGGRRRLRDDLDGAVAWAAGASDVAPPEASSAEAPVPSGA